MEDHITRVYYSPYDISKLVGGSPTTVSMCCSTYKIPHSTTASGKLRFTKEQLPTICAVVKLQQVFKPEYIKENNLHKKLGWVAQGFEIIDKETANVFKGKIDMRKIYR